MDRTTFSMLTIVGIEILFSKFLNFLSMECDNEISSNKDEFDFSLLNNEINSIHQEIDDKEKKK